MKLEVPTVVVAAMKKAGSTNAAFDEGNSWRNVVSIDSRFLTGADINRLVDAAADAAAGGGDECKRLLRKLKILRNACKEGRKFSSLEPLAEGIHTYFSRLPNHRFYVEAQGHFLAYLMKHCEYTPAEGSGWSYRPAAVSISGVAMRRGKQVEIHTNLGAKQLAGGVTVQEVLSRVEWYPESAELNEDYDAIQDIYVQRAGKVGTQFLASGLGLVESEEGRKSRWWDEDERVLLGSEGKSAKVVLDDKADFGSDEGLVPSELFPQSAKGDADVGVILPTHPFLRVFDLGKHTFLTAHSTDLRRYRYDEGLADKLVLAADRKELIDTLIISAGTGADLVEGKGAGVVLLCSGPPGTGKTLTAEVYAERAKLPLYSVQCSQLGTSAESLEEELSEVLSRASRWGAILLIDEADVYIRERGDDINQNAVVGVFLRLLEYYGGVLFLTTNRETLVDDAIRSRLTAHIRYTLPDEADRRRVWGIMNTRFEAGLRDSEMGKLAAQYDKASGRSIRNLVRLAKASARGESVTIARVDAVAPFLDIE